MTKFYSLCDARFVDVAEVVNVALSEEEEVSLERLECLVNEGNITKEELEEIKQSCKTYNGEYLVPGYITRELVGIYFELLIENLDYTIEEKLKTLDEEDREEFKKNSKILLKEIKERNLYPKIISQTVDYNWNETIELEFVEVKNEKEREEIYITAVEKLANTITGPFTDGGNSIRSTAYFVEKPLELDTYF